MARIDVVRHVAADPAGVALLLAEPTSWSDPNHTWVVAAPRHIGTRFTAAIEVCEPTRQLATGEVIVKPAGTVGSEIRLVISVPDPSVARDLEQPASEFLGLLGDRARARSFAA